LVRGRRNFGDWISPELCRLLSGREVESASPRDAHLVAVGSVLHRLPNRFWDRRIDVWGAGVMHEDFSARGIHRYHAVRGALTRERVGAPTDTVLGDPGLLVSDLFPAHRDGPKRWDVGLIPHHVDQDYPGVAAFAQRIPGVRVLDILSDWKEFLGEVAACRFVVSSSLHGLVAADAFGIPNAWIQISNQVRGGGFKFHDYYSAFAIGAPKVTPIELVDAEFIERTTAVYSRPNLASIQQQLQEAFPFPGA
jgi:pyruvyltransferase